MRFLVCSLAFWAFVCLSSAPAAEPRPAELKIATGDAEIDRACDLAIRTLKTNVSEKWGKLCPVVAPAWGRCYPAWIHVFDNFWMTKVTPFLYPRDQAEWPVILLSRYQWPSGMAEGGIHDCDGPEAYQAHLANLGLAYIQKTSIENPYLRDHLYIMQVHDLWRHYGDLDLARNLFPSCKKSLDYLYTLKDDDKDGLVESAAILEDVAIGSDKERRGPNAAERFVDQALLYGALIDYETLADVAAEKREADRARSQRAALKRKVNELYWNDRGYYIFALDSRTHRPMHGELASTYANGYAILWRLVPPERVPKMLDYFTSWDFQVPGPILVPPLFGSTAAQLRFPPGVYVNGGCGWGRGYLPSICLALFRNGRKDIAISYLKKMARAANRAGAFHEYWTWEKYTGSTEPAGCRDYSETASAFLDSVIHGYFGLRPLEPGWRTLEVAPWPIAGAECSITIGLPGGQFAAAWKRSGEKWNVHLRSDIERIVEVVAPGGSPSKVTVKGEREVEGP